MFIALEGIDGVGKTTTCQLLQERLSLQKKTTVIHDPDESECIGKFVIEHRTRTDISFDAKIWAMLYACSSINIQSGVNGYLKKINNSEIVILDRTVVSTYAYYFEKCEFSWLDEIHKPYRHPELTIIIDLDPKVNIERLLARDDGSFMPSLEQILILRERYHRTYLHLTKIGIPISYLKLSGTETKTEVMELVYSIITAKMLN